MARRRPTTSPHQILRPLGCPHSNGSYLGQKPVPHQELHAGVSEKESLTQEHTSLIGPRPYQDNRMAELRLPESRQEAPHPQPRGV